MVDQCVQSIVETKTLNCFAQRRQLSGCGSPNATGIGQHQPMPSPTRRKQRQRFGLLFPVQLVEHALQLCMQLLSAPLGLQRCQHLGHQTAVDRGRSILRQTRDEPFRQLF